MSNPTDVFRETALRWINEQRAAHELPQVTLNEGICGLADANCAKWINDTNATHLPDSSRQHYIAAGIYDALEQNVYRLDAEEEQEFEQTADAILEKIEKAQKHFWDTNAKEKQMILEPNVTHLGFGIGLTSATFRFIQVFVNEYVVLEAEGVATLHELASADTVLIKGQVRAPEIGIYGALIVNKVSEELVQTIPPSDLQLNGDEFAIPINPTYLAPADYDLRIYVHRDRSSLSYEPTSEPIDLRQAGVLASCLDAHVPRPETPMNVVITDIQSEEPQEGRDEYAKLQGCEGFDRTLFVQRVPFNEALMVITDAALRLDEDVEKGYQLVSLKPRQSVEGAQSPEAGVPLFLALKYEPPEKAARMLNDLIICVVDEDSEKPADYVCQTIICPGGEPLQLQTSYRLSQAEAIETLPGEEVAQEDDIEAPSELREDVENNEEEEDQFDAVLELNSQQQEYDRLSRLFEEASEQKESLLATNSVLQKNLVPLLQKKQDNKERKEDKMNAVENEKRYLDCLNGVHDACAQLQRAQAQYDRIAMELQERLDEKEFKANEIQESFNEFKREIAKSAENSRTGKPIPKRIIAQFEAAEGKKDHEVERVRLKNINLRTHLRKLEQKLRAKEQLAEGLHLIDFEQLKIENQTLNEKIEERNEELHKLRKKTTDTVQVLTHIKEKLQFVQVENHGLKRMLGELDAELNENRDLLTKAKKERDANRTTNAALRQKQGFANSDLLVQDYENRAAKLEQLEAKKQTLSQRLAYLKQKSHEFEVAKSQMALRT